MESLIRLITIAQGKDPDSGEEFGLDMLETRIWLQGLVRALADEDLAAELGRRLYEHERPSDLPAWEDLYLSERNNHVLKALNVLDALRDLITEELFPGD